MDPIHVHHQRHTPATHSSCEASITKAFGAQQYPMPIALLCNEVQLGPDWVWEIALPRQGPEKQQ